MAVIIPKGSFLSGQSHLSILEEAIVAADFPNITMRGD
jgi:hypothetical protein